MTQIEKHDYLCNLYTAIYMSEMFDREMESGALFIPLRGKDFVIYIVPGAEQYCSGEDFPENNEVGISIQHELDESGLYQNRLKFFLTFDLKVDLKNFLKVANDWIKTHGYENDLKR